MKGNQERVYDLEERLVSFSVLIIKISETLPRTLAGVHLARQLIRSGTSTSLNYGEAQSGESRKDFIHKMKIGLKELRETKICLRIIERSDLVKSKTVIKKAILENLELISIFVKSIHTARINLNKGKLKIEN